MSPKIDVEVKETIMWDAALVVVGTACVPVIVKMGLVVATKLVTSVVAIPSADIAIAWTQSTSPPFPVPLHLTSVPSETAMPAIVVVCAADTLYTDAPSASVTAFHR